MLKIAVSKNLLFLKAPSLIILRGYWRFHDDIFLQRLEIINVSATYFKLHRRLLVLNEKIFTCWILIYLAESKIEENWRTCMNLI